MKRLALTAAALLAASAAAHAQDSVKPCKQARQAYGAQPADAPPGAQEATGMPQPDQSRQTAAAAPCEEAPPTTR
jgi:opacity protein-like surface antigen